jgi:hypothetical protein
VLKLCPNVLVYIAVTTLKMNATEAGYDATYWYLVMLSAGMGHGHGLTIGGTVEAWSMVLSIYIAGCVSFYLVSTALHMCCLSFVVQNVLS